jgi:uncharacterized membrane protein YhaH (DUF805 family)
MAFIRAILSALANSFNYRGRANRREFWFWLLFVVIVYLLLRHFELNYLTPMAGFMPFEEVPQFPLWLEERPDLTAYLSWMPGYLTWVSWGWVALAMIPTAALIVRRVHDHGHSGWLALTVLPLAWWLTTKGQKGENRYGS